MDKGSIGKVQTRATKIPTSMRYMCINRLEYRRVRRDLIQIKKSVNFLDKIKFENDPVMNKRTECKRVQTGFVLKEKLLNRETTTISVNKSLQDTFF